MENDNSKLTENNNAEIAEQNVAYDGYYDDDEDDGYDVSSYDEDEDDDDNYDDDSYDDDSYDDDSYDDESYYDDDYSESYYDDDEDEDSDYESYDDNDDYAKKGKLLKGKRRRLGKLLKKRRKGSKRKFRGKGKARKALALKKWANYVDPAISYLEKKKAVSAAQQRFQSGANPLEVAAALSAQKQPIPGTNIGMTADLPGGWLRRTWLRLVREGAIARTMTGGRIGATGSTIARHVYTSMNELLAAARTAVAGQSLKSISPPAIAAAGVNTVATLTGNTIFAVIIRISSNALTYERTPVTCNVEYGEGSYSFSQTYLIAPGPKPFFEAVILLPANNAGMGVIARSNQARVTIPADSLAVGTKLTLESVNGRDI